MAIEVAQARHDEALVLSPIGRLDSDSAHAFESVVMGHIRKGERRLVVDFGRLAFISSSGLRILLIAAKTLRAEDGTIVLCAMKDHIREVFQISGFGHIIPIEDSLEAALASA